MKRTFTLVVALCSINVADAQQSVMDKSASKEIGGTTAEASVEVALDTRTDTSLGVSMIELRLIDYCREALQNFKPNED